MNANEKLKKYLEEHGITQSFICKQTGLSADKVSNIITCKRKMSADELASIAKALNVSIDIFF